MVTEATRVGQAQREQDFLVAAALIMALETATKEEVRAALEVASPGVLIMFVALGSQIMGAGNATK